MSLTESQSYSSEDSMADEPSTEQPTHYQTAPEDKISLAQKLIYGLGAFVKPCSSWLTGRPAPINRCAYRPFNGLYFRSY